MRYIAAYLLAVLGGNESPSEKDVTAILEAVGVSVDEERLKLLFAELDGKDINQLLADGAEKLATVGGVGGGGGGDEEEDEEEEEEEEEESEEESEGEEGGMGLFD